MMLLVIHDTEQLNVPKKLCPLTCHVLCYSNATSSGPDFSWCASDTEEPTVTAKTVKSHCVLQKQKSRPLLSKKKKLNI